MRKIHLKYYYSKNWGDLLSPYLVELISNKKVVHFKDTSWTRLFNRLGIRFKDNYICIGSVLGSADRNSIVWGAGFISDKIKLTCKPRKVLAVRGPLTRCRLLEQGIKCPEVYGDPALLFPRFYYPKKVKHYKLGIIPHFIDKDNPWLNTISNDRDILILDIEGGIKEFVDDLLSCETIASSSLHGIIASDAYEIPSIWIKISDKVKGDGFKFRDYFASVGRKITEPIIINENTSILDITKLIINENINIDLDKLWDACPWKNK